MASRLKVPKRRISRPAAPVRRKELPPVVGIGASAGGLEAMEDFFRHAPLDTGLCFILVPHLAPDHHSLLTEILQKATRMPVMEAEDRTMVRADRVYIIPPDREMTLVRRSLRLSKPDKPRGKRFPINTFFKSLAEDQGRSAVGIILSGTGTDGTAGLAAIFEAGGRTLVQDPATAKYEGMPANAIQCQPGHRVSAVADMPGLLLGTWPPPLPATTPSIPEDGLFPILAELKRQTGHDFSCYKQSTIRRRVERRLAQHQLSSFKDYLRYLRENPPESPLLLKELLINVTHFFRDPDAFKALEENILPPMLDALVGAGTFRAWLVGCATGEEAYSLAMLVREWMAGAEKTLHMKIYATDLDAEAIAHARGGLYSAEGVEGVSPERLRKFFRKEGDQYRVRAELRESVVFAEQNVIKDPPFTKLDLLVCRNLLIYLELDLQNRIIPIFHHALKPDGILFLSPSEGIGNQTDLFTVVDRKWKFYRARVSPGAMRTLLTSPVIWSGKSPIPMGAASPENPMGVNLAEWTRRMLVQVFAPPSVVVNRRGEILFVHGDTGPWLRPAPGHASQQVLDMAREGIGKALRLALHAAETHGTGLQRNTVYIRSDGKSRTVNVIVRPLPGDSSMAGEVDLYLVCFEEIKSPGPKARGGKTEPPMAAGARKRLEQALADTRERLEAILASHQGIHEDLRSGNEELQSSNEELQSTNEELETSKEELQSVNEELITVNAELQTKIEDLSSMQNDMKNLIDNIHSGTVFLDEGLVIRRFTREATRIFRLVPSDIGRSLGDIKSDIQDLDLLSAAREVLRTLVPFEKEIRLKEGLWFLTRIQPYRTLDQVISGLVLTFTDISDRVRIEQAEHHARAYAESIVNTIREPLLVLDESLQVVSANPAFYQFFRVKPVDTVGRKIYDLGNRQWSIPALRELLENILTQQEVFEGYDVAHDFPEIGHHLLKLNGRRLVSPVGKPSCILLAMEPTP